MNNTNVELRRELLARINEPSSLYNPAQLGEWAMDVRELMFKALEALGGRVDPAPPLVFKSSPAVEAAQSGAVLLMDEVDAPKEN